MDQGVGLFLKSLQDFGFENNTLVILTADNGIPYPNAKTNLYEPGVGEPMIISNPMATGRWGQETQALASTTDIVPTILDWFGLKFPEYSIFGSPAMLLGKSLLPILNKEPTTGFDTVLCDSLAKTFMRLLDTIPCVG
jgi:N-sulfoglucosamine sulfohydrolase